ncbi:head-tail joining protein [Synechococcus virus S-ESS1]|uniref:Head-tail joining protein n=1 Tax=Synechococcus virus S-ESS1 TaxID=1964565 RepID=A0A1V0DX17_9CAUD|nr:head-tail adaptor Ad1 [Synechococcus virus S-ESS1]ARB05702.1 head-tail joining protein [Synechococcus virus S-ESS1]
MALTAEETTLYTTRLAEAEAALHQLMMGTQARTFVDQNGERVEFTAGNSQKLRAYIYELKMKLGKVSSCGPMRVSMI